MSEQFRTPWLSDVVAILKEDITTRIMVGNKEFVQVVRCKDCRHSFTGNYFNGFACTLLSGEHTVTVKPDGFCSRGETKENGIR